ncbi:MAG: hypothetical protein LBT14_12270 [Treponema sp.]|nr:hypothetical protein [Treponema sp.]
MGMIFIFTCKDESHPWITEQVAYGDSLRRTNSGNGTGGITWNTGING